LRTLGNVEGKRILDLGCGKGRVSRRLEDAGACVIGLDPSFGMLQHAGNLPGVQASACRLPFRDESFDAVIAVEVFEHLGDVDAAIAECARVCRTGATLAVLDKNRHALNADRPWLPAALVKRIDERRGRWMYPADAPIRERWFGIGELTRRLSVRFDAVRHESLLRPSEAGAWIFRASPRSRLFVLWSAKSPTRLT
jgi:2-polyprenyl-6-hydroxyphenyl methylase/3-demethylubiquinone-9 3-methyltransferase